MPLLSEVQQDNAKALTRSFSVELENIKQACRDRKADGQLDGVKTASRVLDDFFTLAASQYKVPDAPASLAYSSLACAA